MSYTFTRSITQNCSAKYRWVMHSYNRTQICSAEYRWFIHSLDQTWTVQDRQKEWHFATNLAFSLIFSLESSKSLKKEMQSNENTGNNERYFYQVCVVAKLCLIPVLTAKEVKHKKIFWTEFYWFNIHNISIPMPNCEWNGLKCTHSFVSLMNAFKHQYMILPKHFWQRSCIM